MRRPRRITRQLKWAVALLCGLEILACLPWVGGYSGPRFTFTTGRGQFVLQYLHTPYPKNPVIVDSYGWFASRTAWSDLLVTDTGHRHFFARHVAYVAVFDRHHYFQVTAVLWVPLLVTLLACFWLWRRDRRLRLVGCCNCCGYDLTGNTSGICPECGNALASVSR